MKSFVFYLMIILMIFTVFSCSKKNTEQAALEDKLSDLIERLDIEPIAPRSNGYVRVIPKYRTNKNKHLLNLKYEWRVNGKPVPDVKSILLEKKYFKKKDSVYCVVQIRQGKKILAKIKSKKVRIANSPPKILDKPLPRIKIPGLMLYQIEATDADNDELEYTLVSPLDMGIDFDVKTGMITWTINSDILSMIEAKKRADEEASETDISEKNPSETMNLDIHFQVSDGDGGLEVRKLTLEYVKDKRKPILRHKDEVR